MNREGKDTRGVARVGGAIRQGSDDVVEVGFLREPGRSG